MLHFMMAHARANVVFPGAGAGRVNYGNGEREVVGHWAKNAKPLQESQGSTPPPQPFATVTPNASYASPACTEPRF